MTGGIQPHADPVAYIEILIWLIAFPDYCGLVATFFQVSVNTIIAGVKFRTAEPGRSGGGEIAGADLIPGFKHSEKLVGLLCPESFGIIDGFLIHLIILRDRERWLCDAAASDTG